MAQSVLVIAESGAGKSTAIRNLRPEETFIINVANKPLPFKGWKNLYPIWSKRTKKVECIPVRVQMKSWPVLSILMIEDLRSKTL